MEDYSPSHPTDQDADGDNLTPCSENRIYFGGYGHEKQRNNVISSSQRVSASAKNVSVDPFSTSVPSSHNVPVNILNMNKAHPTAQPPRIIPRPAVVLGSITEDTHKNNDGAYKLSDNMLNDAPKSLWVKRNTGGTVITNDGKEKDRRSKFSDRKSSYSSKEKVGISYKESTRHSNDKSSRYRSPSPQRRRNSKSPQRRTSGKRSSSRSRSKYTRNRRQSRSKSKERRYRHSSSREGSRRDYRGRDSVKNQTTRFHGRSHQDKPTPVDSNKFLKDQRQPEKNPSPARLAMSSVPPPPPPLPESIHTLEPIENPRDMDKTSTPDISEERQPPLQCLNNSTAYKLENHPPPPAPMVATSLVNWQQPFTQQFLIQSNPASSLTQIPSTTLVPTTFVHRPRAGGYANNFHIRGINAPSVRELPPNLILQRPSLNHAQANRFSVAPPDPMMMFESMLDKTRPFGGILTQPPPLALPNMLYTTPPPPFIQQMRPPPNPTFQQSLHTKVPLRPPVSSPPQQPPLGPSNLLETLMSKAGLPTDGITGLSGPITGGPTTTTATTIPLPNPVEDKTPMNDINTFINSAANKLLSQLNLSIRVTSSPPPPPPPPLPLRSVSKPDCPVNTKAQFVPPPLPTIVGNISCKGQPNGKEEPPDEPNKKEIFLKYDAQEMLAKRNRSEFNSTREWQERIALEVKSFIKPFYATKKISSEDCRTILKKSVNKISRSRCTSINTKKIGEFVKLYIRKYYKYRKWQARQQKLQSSIPSTKGPTV